MAQSDGWSTQELADLAGTTLRTVRYYHEIGLLPEPPRGPNGYKHYGVSHLTRLLRIRRLVELGAPLSQIREMDVGGAPDSAPADYVDKLKSLDAEAEASIARLQLVRSQIAHELAAARTSAGESGQPAGDGDSDTPGAPVAGPPLEPADEDFLTVASRVVSAETAEAWNRFGADAGGRGALAEFTRLDPDSPPEARADLARRLAVAVRDLRSESPELTAPSFGSGRHLALGRRALQVAMRELYSDAQLEVLARTGALLDRDG